MEELVSIVLPVYNGERFLRESIESVCSQTYKNWELIIVDDCSSDMTPEICKEYAEKDQRIKYYRNEKNLKLPGNLNRGFQLTSGNYLTWTSDDNKYRPEAIKRMVQALKEIPEAGLVYASYQVIDEDDNIILIEQADMLGINQITGANVVGACFMFTREAYVKTGEYDETLFLVEDFAYWQRMMACTKTITISDVLYDYRWHSKSLTSTKNKKKYGAALEKMLKKNRSLYDPMNMEQKRCYYQRLRVGYRSQGYAIKGSFQAFFYEYLFRFVRKINTIVRRP